MIYFFDVKLLGLPANVRHRNWFRPCECCGWSNKYAGDYMFKSEKDKLKEAHNNIKESTSINNNEEDSSFYSIIEGNDKLLNKNAYRKGSGQDELLFRASL